MEQQSIKTENKYREINIGSQYQMVMDVLCFIIMTVMFYLREGDIKVGGFGVMYYYIAAIFLVGIAFIDLLLRPNIKRFNILINGSMIYIMPYLIPLIDSFCIWIIHYNDASNMQRGLQYTFYQILQILTATAVVYVCGSKGVWLWLMALALANGITFVEVVLEYGLPQTFNSFWILLLTFGNDTRAEMRALEIHDTTFSYGPFLILLLIYRNKIKHWKLYLIIQTFFFLLGLKRIAIAAIVLAVILVEILSRKKQKLVSRFVHIVWIFAIIGQLVYIWLVHAGLFNWLEEMGLDTKGRDLIYQYVIKQYDFDITFFGRGLGFSQLEWDVGGRWQTQLRQDAYHNDYLKMFVEIGFIPYIMWIWTHIWYRFDKFFKFNRNTGLVFFAVMIYTLINYMTDNTFYYFYVTGQTYMTVLGSLTNEMERHKEWE